MSEHLRIKVKMELPEYSGSSSVQASVKVDTDSSETSSFPSTSNQIAESSHQLVTTKTESVFYSDLFKCVKECPSKTQKSQIDSCTTYVKGKFEGLLSDAETRNIELICTSFVKLIRKKLHKFAQHFDRVEQALKAELQKTFPVNLCDNVVPPLPQTRKESSQRQIETPRSTRYRRIAKNVKVLNVHSPKTLLQVAARKVKKQGKVGKARNILAALSTPSPSTRSIASSLIPTMMTAEEALFLVLDLHLSRQQYQKLRENALAHNCNMYPSYKLIQEAKQACRPGSSLEVTETKAKISLQSLLDHTSSRIIKYLTAGNDLHFPSQVNTTLICSWGFDGSSGQALYKQPSQSTCDWSNLLTTHIIPLQLIDIEGTCYWTNPTPQSVRYCRPLKLEFIKESTDAILQEKQKVEEEIQRLQHCSLRIGDSVIQINYKLALTVIDGKVFSAILGTASPLTCPICKLSISSLNKIEDCKLAAVESQTLKHGLSPLHAWLRCFDFVIHLSYKLPVKRWRVTDPNEKREVENKKLHVQKEFKERLGLLIDMPKPGGCGTTNDGNTSRRALANAETFSEITGVNLQLIKDLRTILITINSGLPIDNIKFGSFCDGVAKRYVDLYGWCYMTPTLHKILIHGEKIIESSILPIGMLGEEAAEARNKYYKHDRLHHTRKDTRAHTMEDLFFRAMDHSDPFLSSFETSYNKRKRKRTVLPLEVIDLLKEADVIVGDCKETLQVFSEEFAVQVESEVGL